MTKPTVPFLAKKNRGKFKGQLLFPHLHIDGSYVATTSKFKVDYVKVGSLAELEALVRAGYGARMSNPEIRHAPSYIAHSSIIFDTEENRLMPLKRLLSSFAENDELDGRTVAKSRKEQVFLRTYLLRGHAAGNCVLCGRCLPAELLVAAHIKPRSECTREEKLDFDDVAALMCTLGCDGLFEKGFVYVDEGVIMSSADRPQTADLESAIGAIAGRKVINWPSSSAYYRWHASQFD